MAKFHKADTIQDADREIDQTMDEAFGSDSDFDQTLQTMFDPHKIARAFILMWIRDFIHDPTTKEAVWSALKWLVTHLKNWTLPIWRKLVRLINRIRRRGGDAPDWVDDIEPTDYEEIEDITPPEGDGDEAVPIDADADGFIMKRLTHLVDMHKLAKLFLVGMLKTGLSFDELKAIVDKELEQMPPKGMRWEKISNKTYLVPVNDASSNLRKALIKILKESDRAYKYEKKSGVVTWETEDWFISASPAGAGIMLELYDGHPSKTPRLMKKISDVRKLKEYIKEEGLA